MRDRDRESLEDPADAAAAAAALLVLLLLAP